MCLFWCWQLSSWDHWLPGGWDGLSLVLLCQSSLGLVAILDCNLVMPVKTLTTTFSCWWSSPHSDPCSWPGDSSSSCLLSVPGTDNTPRCVSRTPPPWFGTSSDLFFHPLKGAKGGIFQVSLRFIFEEDGLWKRFVGNLQKDLPREAASLSSKFGSLAKDSTNMGTVLSFSPR